MSLHQRWKEKRERAWLRRENKRLRGYLMAYKHNEDADTCQALTASLNRYLSGGDIWFVEGKSLDSVLTLICQLILLTFIDKTYDVALLPRVDKERQLAWLKKRSVVSYQTYQDFYHQYIKFSSSPA